jgi:hypothetical protein
MLAGVLSSKVLANTWKTTAVGACSQFFSRSATQLGTVIAKHDVALVRWPNATKRNACCPPIQGTKKRNRLTQLNRPNGSLSLRHSLISTFCRNRDVIAKRKWLNSSRRSTSHSQYKPSKVAPERTLPPASHPVATQTVLRGAVFATTADLCDTAFRSALDG